MTTVFRWVLVAVASIVVAPSALAKPVEYEKVCSLYGPGFFYVPGTDTCLKVATGETRQVTENGIWPGYALSSPQEFVPSARAGCEGGRFVRVGRFSYDDLTGGEPNRYGHHDSPARRLDLLPGDFVSKVFLKGGFTVTNTSRDQDGIVHVNVTQTGHACVAFRDLTPRDPAPGPRYSVLGCTTNASLADQDVTWSFAPERTVPPADFDSPTSVDLVVNLYDQMQGIFQESEEVDISGDLSVSVCVRNLEDTGLCRECRTEGPNHFDFGVANDLNLLSCGKYKGGRDIGGPLAVQGVLALAQGFSVGFELPHTDGKPALVAAAGSIIAESGQFYGAVYSFDENGDQIADDVGYAERGGLSICAPLDMPLNTDTMCADVREVSLSLCAATGTTAPGVHIPLEDATWWGETYLTITEPGTNVFRVDGDDLIGAHTFFVRNPDDIPGASVLANVYAGQTGIVSTERGEVRLEDDVTSDQVLFNFCDTTVLSFEGSFGGGAYGFYASLVAPFADVRFNYGQVRGNVIVGSLDGDVELHHVPFAGRLDLTSSCDAVAPQSPRSLSRFCPQPRQAP